MPLTSGSRLGPYEIISVIGSGGMGEVYRAKDPQIGRDVAIKILPSTFTQNPDRLRRFEIEARTAGSLNHPNIIIVHMLGNHQGSPYLVSELLDGQTLRERLRHGISKKEAIDFARQIATGLGAAHNKGITHRDLKPENIFITTDGRVKILDFGLAKLTEVHTEGPVSGFQTTVEPTEPGVILGTVGYMSPELVRGMTVDSRSDIFSFGLILFEMIAGKPAFRCESSVETMNAILNEDPTALFESDATVSPSLMHIIRRCIEKNPASRFQSADDLAFALGSLVTSTKVTVTPKAGRHLSPFIWLVAALFLVISAGIVWFSIHTVQPDKVVVSAILPPPGVRSVFQDGLALSPDGKVMAFSAVADNGKRQIWLRHLEREQAFPVEGTERGVYPFWSPDGKHIGFFAGGYLKRIPSAGGAVRTLCRASLIGKGGTWSPDGFIVFSNGGHETLQRVSSDGGEPSNVFPEPQTPGLGYPFLSPDGKHLLFASRLEEDHAYVVPLSDLSGRKRLTSPRGGRVEFASSSQILYVKNRILQAHRIDLHTGTLLGEPTVIAQHVATPMDWESFSVSQEGTLVVYTTDTAESLTSTELVWLDRTGRVVERIPRPGSIWTARISPDASSVAYNRGDHIWIHRSQSGEPVPLTVGEKVFFHFPVWSPDSSRLVIYEGEPRRDVYRAIERPLEGLGIAPKVLIPKTQNPSILINDWSRDDRFMLANNLFGNMDIFIYNRAQNKVSPLISTEANEINAVFSPDTKWIAYQSDETGDFEIYVRPLDATTTVSRRLSSEGGSHPRWRADGKELFYLKPDGSIMSIEIQTRPFLQTKPPILLFRTLLADIIQGTTAPYDVSPDGQRFLIIAPLTGQPSVSLIQNWPSLTER